MCASWLSFSALATVLCAVASSLPFDDGFSAFSLSSSQQFHDFFDSDDESNDGFENPIKEYVRTRRRIQGGPPSNFRPEDVFDIERPLFDTADPDDRRNPRPVQERNPAHAEIDGLRPLPIQRPFDDGPPGRSQSSGNPSFQKLEPVFHQSVQPEGPYDPHYSRSPEETRSATDGRLSREPSLSQRLNPGDANEAQPPHYDAQPQAVKYHPHFSYTEPPQQKFSQVDNSQQHPGLFQAEENKQSVDDRSRVHISPAYYDDFLEKQQEELQLYRPQNEDKRREHSDQRQQQYQHQQESRQGYQQPQRPYEQPQQTFEQGQQTFEQPRRPFEQEQQTYEQRQQTYEQPQLQYEQGQQTFEQPRRPFEQGQQTFEQGQQTFEQGQQTFEQPRRPFEQGQQTYKQPQQTYEQPQEQQRSPLFYEEIGGVEQPPRDRDTPQLHNADSVLKASDQQSFAKKQAPRHSAYNYKTKKPVPLQPVYSKDQPPSFRDETRPVSITGRVHENEVLFDHLPEYQETFRDNSPVGESKEKRQALHGHGGGYMDHNGLEFAAAASAAEHAHGKGGDGRLTFQLHGQKGPHSYRFGFDTGKGPHRQFRYEERDNDGTVKGRYGYYDSHGKLQMYNYSAHPDHGYEAAEAH